MTFSAAPGTISNRFILRISNVPTGNEDPIGTLNKFNIYYGFDLINIQTLADDWNGTEGSVKITDMAGKSVSDLQNAEFNKDALDPAAGSKNRRTLFYRDKIGA